jgi:CDP-diacylglycerol--glycerol-3-phosphate 3-phosphatidyltransferase
MTLPNKLTLTRLLAAPLVFLSWYIPFHLGLSPKFGSILIWVLFLVSEVTDILDGHFARTLGQVSDVGKLMDPFSDVFLRVTYFTCFVGAGFISWRV